MRVLVTGASGQVGQNLVQQLQNTGWDYLALNRSQLDITDADAVSRVIGQYKPLAIINAAAYTAVDKAEQEVALAYGINRDGTANLARAAQTQNAVLLHLSTDYVFSGNQPGCYREEDATEPLGIYGHSKLAGELAAADLCIKHIILRTSWVFGEQGNNFVKTMIRLGRNRDSLSIVADQEGGPTYAGDIAAALIEILRQYSNGKNIAWGTYHYSGQPYTSWFGFAQAIFTQVANAGIYNKPVPTLSAITSAEYPTPAKRPTNSRLDNSKFLATFGVAASDWKAALNNISAYTE